MPLTKLNNLTSRLLKWLNLIKSGIGDRTYYTYSPEPAQFIPKKETCWATAKDALSVLKSGDSIVSQAFAATPQVLLQAMAEVGKENCLKDIKVYHILTEGKLAYCQPEYAKIFRHVSLFVGPNERKAVAEGRADYIPIFLHEVAKLFSRKMVQPDIVLISVSPPDEHGYCSLGINVDYTRAAMVYAKMIIAQVNHCMPRTFGDGIIHMSHIDYAVEVNMPLFGSKPGKINRVEAKIGKIIADELIEDGATLQMGIGAIPDAVLHQLNDHKDLGIHSEMFSDGVVDLYYKGVITNNKKNMHRGRTVGSFVRGSQKLYDFLDNNPSVELLRAEYVNDVKIICQQPKMTAINSGLEIDITGQVVSDSIGTLIYSGFGGQIDFTRGAGDSLDGKGKPIIAFPSVTKNNKSKICSTITPGAGVVTTRGHIWYVVTEYGIASLFGKSLRQRAYELINIAHPDHREALTKAAFDRFKAMPSK